MNFTLIRSTCSHYFRLEESSSSPAKFCRQNQIFICTENWILGDRKTANWQFFGLLDSDGKLTTLVHECHGKIINHLSEVEEIPHILHKTEKQGTAPICQVASKPCFKNKISESHTHERIVSASR